MVKPSTPPPQKDSAIFHPATGERWCHLPHRHRGKMVPPSNLPLGKDGELSSDFIIVRIFLNQQVYLYLYLSSPEFGERRRKRFPHLYYELLRRFYTYGIFLVNKTSSSEPNILYHFPWVSSFLFLKLIQKNTLKYSIPHCLSFGEFFCRLTCCDDLQLKIEIYCWITLFEVFF